MTDVPNGYGRTKDNSDDSDDDHSDGGITTDGDLR